MHMEIDDQDEVFRCNKGIVSFIFVFNILSISSFYANISSLCSLYYCRCAEKKKIVDSLT